MRARRSAARSGVAAREARGARGRSQHQKRDPETRERVLASALELFAERGFEEVTVRDLSQHARVNLAAISYHFGDKLGLYRELLDMALRRIRAFQDEHIERVAGLKPEEQLRQYMLTYLSRMAGPRPPHLTQLQKLLRHEMMNPSPLGQRMIDQGIMPRLRYLGEIVSKLLDCPPDDQRVKLCVISVQAQTLFFVHDSSRPNLLKEWFMGHEDIDIAKVADHLAAFSLAGIRAMKR